jgi:ribosomal protein L7/L12
MQSFAQLIAKNADADQLREILSHIDERTIKAAIAAAMGYYGSPIGGAGSNDFAPEKEAESYQWTNFKMAFENTFFRDNDEKVIKDIVKTIYSMQMNGISQIKIIEKIRTVYYSGLKETKDLVFYLSVHKDVLKGN